MISELASCVPAFAVGAGAHFVVDVIGYVLVFAIGSKVGHACSHKHAFRDIFRRYSGKP